MIVAYTLLGVLISWCLCLSCRAVMSDRKAVIKNADMSEDMQQDAVECATQALEKYNIEKDIAAYIKKVYCQSTPAFYILTIVNKLNWLLLNGWWARGDEQIMSLGRVQRILSLDLTSPQYITSIHN